jgi:hypothetical protein
MGLAIARWVSVHEVNVRMSLGKRVPLGHLQETPWYGVPRLTGAR